MVVRIRQYRVLGSRVLLGLLAALQATCSALVDTAHQQCAVDADCQARGLLGVCVENLCQPGSGSAGNGTQRSGIDATGAGTMAQASATPMMQDGGGIQGRAGSASTTGSSAAGAPAAGTLAVGMSTAGEMMSTPATLGMAGTSGSTGAAGTTGANACEGSHCPECSVDADCERRGVAGGTCVDAMCWAPKPECSMDQDCTARGPEFVGGRCTAGQCRPNPKWRCEPPAAAPPTGTMVLTVPIIDALVLSYVPNIRIQACNKLDVMCAEPVGEAVSGSDGRLKITVPANFAGYLQQNDGTTYAKAMYFLPVVLPPDGMLPNYPLLTSGLIIDALAIGLGAGLDPKRGHMMLIANDCSGTKIAGITFTSPQMDKSTVQFYVRDQLPSTTAKDTPDTGEGGYLNFPAGTALITAKEVKSGIELATVSVLVRPDYITVYYIRPATR